MINLVPKPIFALINYEFISSNKIIFHFLSSLKIPDSTQLSLVWNALDGKTINNSVSEYFSNSIATNVTDIENLVAKSRYSKIISF